MDAERKAVESGEKREFPNGTIDVVSVGGHTFARGRFQPGWRWSEHVKPIAGTDSCQVEHVGYVITGRMGIRMDDGSEFEFGAGDAYRIPAGHDGWVIGDEQYEFVDVQIGDFAKRRS